MPNLLFTISRLVALAIEYLRTMRYRRAIAARLMEVCRHA